MLIAEDLLLLLTKDDTGRLAVEGSQVDAALAGAQLIDLSLAERVDVDDRTRLVVRSTEPLEDPLLDAALRIVADKQGKKPSSVIGPLGKKLRPAVYDRLVERGLLRREQGKVLGLFPTTSWPAQDAAHEEAVRRAVTHALVQPDVAPDPRTGALVALLHALRCTHKVVDHKAHGIGRWDLDKRAKRIAEGSWGSEAVRRAVDETIAATMVAVTAATTAATASSGS